jgi:hypothetical protein
MFNTLRAVKEANILSMDPEREFSYKESLDRLALVGMPSGREPNNLLHCKYIILQSGKVNKLGGIVPSNLLLLKSNILKWLRFPSDGGIAPVRKLLESFRTSRK